MSKSVIIGTGLKGLVGSKIVSELATEHEFVNLDVNDPVAPTDITNRDQLEQRLDEHPEAKFLIHFAAFTDVTKAWEQRGQKDGVAYRVNVVGTEHIANACAARNIHLIHISTAYVFDGEKNGLYTEDDQPHPIEWYGETKWLAEQAVRVAARDWTILRIDQPFRSDPFDRPDVVQRLIKNLRAGTLPPQFANHTFGPTFIDDFAKVIEWVTRTGTTGLFHASSGESWTDLAFAQAVQAALKLPGSIEAGDLDAYLQKSQRPYQRNTAMDVSKLTTQLDFSLTPIADALQQVQLPLE
jgi:dTDP-4-dehydrorhamnose reductase